MTLRFRAPARALGIMLGLSFAFTVLGFVTATLLAMFRAQGIAAAAYDITNNGAPSIASLSSARTDLRHAEITLDDYVDALQTGEFQDVTALRASLRDMIENVDRDWNVYKNLPTFPGETAMWPPVDAAQAEVHSSVMETLRRANTGDLSGARRFMDFHARPAIQRLDDVLHTLLEFNAQHVARLGSEIMHVRERSRLTLVALEAISVLFAAVAAVLVTRIVRDYARLMEQRVGDLESFAGRVAHDIRSPLASVGLTLDIARRDLSTQSPAQEARDRLERARKTVNRIGLLIDDLLLFARASGPPVEGAKADVREVVRAVVEEMQPAAKEKAISIELDEDGASTIGCSTGVLISIVSNLVANAIKYMGGAEERRITVRLRQCDSRTRLEVEDTGPGIPPALRNRIFEPYIRSADSLVPGFGLGLATVHRLAEAHGGTSGIDVLRVGSRFWVELPREPAIRQDPKRSGLRLFTRMRRSPAH